VTNVNRTWPGCPDRSVLLVGDAKDSETPGCSETFRRLSRYGRAVRGLVAEGLAVRIVICHGDPLSEKAWQATLLRLAAFVGLTVLGRPQSDRLDAVTSVTWVDLGRAV